MALPESWSQDWDRHRLARIVMREGAGFEIKTKYLPSNGRVVSVHRPRVMDPANEGGHSLYEGQVCWDLVEPDVDEPMYLCEADIEWVTT